MEHGNWTLIESDPAVFTDLIKAFGCNGLEVNEVWDLDQFMVMNQSDVYGFIFLFKWDPNLHDDTNFLPWDVVPNVFFAKQVINNACATQAILSVLLNLPIHDPSIELGSQLQQFKSFTSSFDPELKGISITNSEIIRLAHNSFARPEPFANEIGPLHDDDKEDNFHFVTYIPSTVGILELDGLKSGPVHVADMPDNANHRNWISNFIPVIQERIASFAGNEIRFTLLAVQQSKQVQLKNEMEIIQSKMQDMTLSDAQRSDLEREKHHILQQLQIEQEKAERYKRENERRRHNYLPFILELLKQMAKKNILNTSYNNAKQEAISKLEAKKLRND